MDVHGSLSRFWLAGSPKGENDIMSCEEGDRRRVEPNIRAQKIIYNTHPLGLFTGLSRGVWGAALPPREGLSGHGRTHAFAHLPRQGSRCPDVLRLGEQRESQYA